MLETSRVEAPDIRYTQSGDVSIAYAIHGEGAIDVVFVHGHISNLEVEWEDPGHVAFFTRLASAGRVIRFDRRGSGLSDRVREVPTLEARMDDLRAVMDAAGSPRAVLVATFEAASMAMLFAATYPERVAGLVLFYPLAKGVWAPDYPFAPTEDEYRNEFEQIRTGWGHVEQAERFFRQAAPSVADDPQAVAWAMRMFRQGASPGAALALRRMVMNVDVRDVLPSIRVPTLIAHTTVKRDE
jgi:pimeloyl-ACP methyl ester carboxylesterase